MKRNEGPSKAEVMERARSAREAARKAREQAEQGRKAERVAKREARSLERSLRKAHPAALVAGTAVGAGVAVGVGLVKQIPRRVRQIGTYAAGAVAVVAGIVAGQPAVMMGGAAAAIMRGGMDLASVITGTEIGAADLESEARRQADEYAAMMRADVVGPVGPVEAVEPVSEPALG